MRREENVVFSKCDKGENVNATRKKRDFFIVPDFAIFR